MSMEDCIFSILSHRTLYRQEGIYCAFPGLAAGDDQLFLTFRITPAPNQRTHIDTRSGCLICSFRGFDDSFETCTVLKEDHYTGIQDPSITYFGGIVYLSYFVYASLIGRHTKSRVKNGGVRVRWSSDGGLSWDDWGSIPGEVAASEPIIFVKGLPLLAVYQPYDYYEVSDLFYFDTKIIGDIATNPRGKFMSRIAGKPGLNFQEPALLSLGKQLLCIHRVYDSGVGHSVLLINRSNKDLSWTDPIPLWDGVSPNLCRLPDGRIILSYTHRVSKPYRVCARVSEDEGLTWGDEIVLRETDGSWDIGYPSTVVWDGKLITAYYWQDKADKVRRIEGTRWEV